MEQSLTKEDIKNLNYECRPGRIITIIIYLIGVIFLLLNVLDSGNVFYSILIIILSVLLSTSITYLVNNKFRQDLKNGTKILIPKTIKSKVQLTDYEAGSGSLHPSQKMKEFDVFQLIIENTKYSVDKELFDACHEGDIVLFHMGPLSEHRLKIEKQKK